MRDPPSTSDRNPLEPFLLALHGTMEAQEFWGALQKLLDAAFPNQSLIAALRVMGENPPVFYHTHRRPHHTHAWFSQTLAAHPCYAHLMANPGLPVLKLSEVLPPDTIRNHPFYLDYMKPEGWHHGMAFVYWTGNRIDTLIPINRSEDQPDFNDREQALALRLHPQIEVALRRMMTLLTMQDVHRTLVTYLSDLPLPTLRLNWDLKLTFANRQARKLLQRWLNPDLANASLPEGLPKVPGEIFAACAALKASILQRVHDHWPPTVFPPPVRLVHPSHSELTAMIRTTRDGSEELNNPGFWVHLDLQQPTTMPAARIEALCLLSPAEREVAELVMTGRTNNEIASRLNRSLSTVKTHLQSAFRKHGVHNRASLIAKLHRNEADDSGSL